MQLTNSKLNAEDSQVKQDSNEEKNQIIEKKKQSEEIIGDAQKKLPKIKDLDSLAQNFIEEHIQGTHGPGKTRNQVANFHKAKYQPVSKYERARGDLPHQVKMVTKVELYYEETGKENYGQKGQAYFLVTGIKFGKRFTPQHLDGIARPSSTL